MITQYLPYTRKEYMALLSRELEEYKAKIDDMTVAEHKDLRKWVADGYSPYENPCLFCDGDGYVMDYIQALRIEEDMINNPEDYSCGAPIEFVDDWDPNDDTPY